MTTTITKKIVLELVLTKDTPDLLDKVAGRAYTIDGVEDVRLVEQEPGIEELEQENRLLRARNERLESGS